jgi:hypothetical protein
MWQRFTEKTRRVIYFSQEEAARLGENKVGTEHLLLGLLREDDCLAARVLERLEISRVRVRHELDGYLARGDGRLGETMLLTPRSKRVIDHACDEARLLNNDYVGTEHLFLGLVREEDGIAGRVLMKLGVTLESARAAVEAIQEEGPAPAAARGLDRLPGRMLDLLSRWLRDVAAESVRENTPLDDVLRAEFERVLRALQNLRPEAFSDPSSVAQTPPSGSETQSLHDPLPAERPPRDSRPSTEDSRARAVFKVAIHTARRLGSDEVFRAMLQDAIDALGEEDMGGAA